MKLKIIIIIESIAIVLLVLFAFDQKWKANQEAERARVAEQKSIFQRDIAIAAQKEAVKQKARSDRSMELYMAAKDRLEVCKQTL